MQHVAPLARWAHARRLLAGLLVPSLLATPGMTQPSVAMNLGRSMAFAVPCSAPATAQIPFGPPQELTASANGAQSVHATDLDGDGDADVLSASKGDDKIAWYENLGGGVFGAQQVITTSANGAQSVHATDLDGDGDADVLSASQWDDTIAWYENLGGGVFAAQQVITTSADGANSVYATDLDEDGDADVLSALQEDDTIAWYENLMGLIDCNGNGLADSEDLATGTSQDCNDNGIPDECDLSSGTSTDFDQNGVPDECVAPPLIGTPLEVSLLTGGTQQLQLEAPHSLSLYFILGSASGTSPGIPVDGLVLPLNLFDPYFGYTLQHPNTSVLQATLGVLSSSGTGTAAINLPAGLDAGLAGTTLHHAYVVFGSTGGAVFVSNPMPLDLVP